MIRQYSPLISNSLRGIADVKIGNQQFCIRIKEGDIEIYLERANGLWVVHENGQETKSYSTEQVKELISSCAVSNHGIVYVAFNYISDVRKSTLKLKSCIEKLKEMNESR